MEEDEILSVLTDFLSQKEVLSELLEASRTGELSLNVDFSELAKYSIDVADELLEHPDNVLSLFKYACSQFDLPNPLPDDFQVLLFNLPESSRVRISELRGKHLDKLLAVSGIVQQKSDVRPHMTSVKFECPRCGNVITVMQRESVLKQPSQCSCGFKGKFRMISKQTVDVQSLVIEENPEDLDSFDQPRTLRVLLKGALVSPMRDQRTVPGQKIRVNGVLREQFLQAKRGIKTQLEIFLEAVHVEYLEQDLRALQPSPEELVEIYKIADNDPLSVFTKSFAPTIYGHEYVKKAIILQFFSGVRKGEISSDHAYDKRGDINILLVGDPGSGKSEFLKQAMKVAPKVRWAIGRGSSGTGLTAAVVRDEFLGGWSLQAGALPMANGGLAVIDEFDKISEEDVEALHSAMSDQVIVINKATIHATLKTQCGILAAANPKHGRFDQFSELSSQIEFPPTLLTRFDLIFPFKDFTDPEKDAAVIDRILQVHKGQIEVALSNDLFRKYVAYARSNVVPVMTSEAEEVIREFYLSLRNPDRIDMSAFIGGNIVPKKDSLAIPIGTRQAEALIRLAEAHAKMRLSKKVERTDAIVAIDLLTYSLKLLGFDPETGQIDVDRFEGRTSSSKRNQLFIVKKALLTLEKELGTKVIPFTDIFRQVKDSGIDEDTLSEILSRLKNGGDIFEPKPDHYQRLA